MTRRRLVVAIVLAVVLEGVVAVLPHVHHAPTVAVDELHSDHDDRACMVAPADIHAPRACLACVVQAPSVAPPDVRPAIHDVEVVTTLQAPYLLAVTRDRAHRPRLRGPPVRV